MEYYSNTNEWDGEYHTTRDKKQILSSLSASLATLCQQIELLRAPIEKKRRCPFKCFHQF